MRTIEILCGIPCSGKSTFTSKYTRYPGVESVSRDSIREMLYGKQYKFSSKREEFVTKTQESLVRELINNPYIHHIIIDNTHCKEKYINEIIFKYGKDNKIIVTFIDVNILVAHYRNIVRYFKTGKWIPIKVMNNMYKNYKRINKKLYAKYI